MALDYSFNYSLVVIWKGSKEFKSTINKISHLEEIKDIKKEILDTKETVVKEGKELDEFIEKNNEDIMKDKNDWNR